MFAGDLIGKMGNVGTKDQHAHYQIYGPDDPRRQNPINPHVFWNHPFFPDQERFVPRSPSLVPLESPIPDPTYNYLNPAPSESDAVRGFGTGGRFMQGSATSSRPLYETQSFVAPPDDPSQEQANEQAPVRSLVRVSPTGESQAAFDGGASAVPFVPSASIRQVGRPATFDERFGAVAGAPPASIRPLSPFSGQPMRYLPPSVFGIPDASGAPEMSLNDWLAGLARARLRQ
ncbi:hypothetical protein [Bradyrhizobium sp. USDA 4452]